MWVRVLTSSLIGVGSYQGANRAARGVRGNRHITATRVTIRGRTTARTAAPRSRQPTERQPPCRARSPGPASRTVVHRSTGVQPELGGQAVGDGWRMAEQAAQSNQLRRRQPAWAYGAPPQAYDHTDGRRPLVLRSADQDAPEDLGAGRRPLSLYCARLAPSVQGDSARSPSTCHVHLGLSAASKAPKAP